MQCNKLRNNQEMLLSKKETMEIISM